MHTRSQRPELLRTRRGRRFPVVITGRALAAGIEIAQYVESLQQLGRGAWNSKCASNKGANLRTLLYRSSSRARKSNSSGCANVCASATVDSNFDHDKTASMAAKASPPLVRASIRALPILAYSRTFSLIALPLEWNSSAWARSDLTNSFPTRCSNMLSASSVNVAVSSSTSAVSVAYRRSGSSSAKCWTVLWAPSRASLSQ
jgi:hypothetical protein